MGLVELCDDLARLTDADLRMIGESDPNLRAEIDKFLAVVANRKLDDTLSQSVASWEAGPLCWLTKYTCTENPYAEAQGLPFIAPFPRKKYLLLLFNALLNEQQIMIPKSRDMMTSWCACGYAVWRAQWHKWDCILQTLSLDRAKELIDYASQLWRYQPDWLKAKYPLRSADPLTYELPFAHGGRIKAIPSGEDKIRTFKPNFYFQDESAFMVDAEQCWNAANASSSHVQMLGVSTANPGWFAEQVVT